MAGLWADAADGLNRLRVRAPQITAPVPSLSGGNQQRGVLARSRRVLVPNDPSVGVDVGSKNDIHGIIRALSAQGRWG